MNLTNYFGDILAKQIGKSEMACRGLLRFAIQDKFGEFRNNIEYNDLIEIFNIQLKSRLEKIKVNELDQTIQVLLGDLRKNQSLITIASI